MTAANDRDFGRDILNALTEKSLTIPVRMLKKGDVLYVAGESAASVFIVKHGHFKSIVPDYNGRESILDIHSRSDILGESAFANRSRADSAVACDSASVHVVSLPDLTKALENAELKDRWIRHLCARCQEQQILLGQFALMDCERRLAARLLLLSAKVGAAGDTVSLDFHLTQSDLAAMVGTTRSRIGLFLQRFRRHGIVCQTKPHENLAVNRAQLLKYLTPTMPVANGTRM